MSDNFQTNTASKRLLAVGIVVVAASVACDEDHRADLAVYGDHVPELTNRGEPFSAHYLAREANLDAGVVNPATKTLLTAAPGLQTPRGTTAWGVEAWAKYAFLGNYDNGGNGVFQDIEDQRFTVYDTERRSACSFDLNASRASNASVAYMAIANPTARRTRLFFEGVASRGSGGYPFGFVRVDLDNASPCSTSSGWTVKGFIAEDLNRAAAAAGQPVVCPDEPDQPNSFWCYFDGMTLLRHDAATNTSTLVLSNWMHSRIAVVQIDGNETLRVPAVHLLPYWQPEVANTNPDACYKLLPVGPAGADPTRPVTDQRFMQAFDKVCAPADAPNCAVRDTCPFTNTACSGSCAQAYCSKEYLGSYCPVPAAGTLCGGQPASCSNCPMYNPFSKQVECVRLNALNQPILGQPTNQCLRLHANATCAVQTYPEHGNLRQANCGSCPAPATPAQEYGFNGSTGALRATSKIFLRETGEGLVVSAGGYSRRGDLVLTAMRFAPDRAHVIRYGRPAGGEHPYFDASAALSSRQGALVAASWSREWPLSRAWYSFPGPSVEVGDHLYLISALSVQRMTYSASSWGWDANYKSSFGYSAPMQSIPDSQVPAPQTLPQESYYCATASVVSCTSSSSCGAGRECVLPGGYCAPLGALGCQVDADCPSGQICPRKRCSVTKKPCQATSECGASGGTCSNYGGLGELPPQNMRLGGSPPSLWMTPHFGSGRGVRARLNAYLTRIPVSVALPGENTTTVQPALAWSGHLSCPSEKCDRLWLIAAPGGVLRYRTRDQGLWTGWHSLPSNVPITGGVSAVLTGTQLDFSDAHMELFGRNASGALYLSRLTAPLDCSPGSSCSWSPWTAVAGAPASNFEPSTTMTFIGDPPALFVAVTDTSGQLRVAERRGATWTAWRTIAGLLSDAAPSLMYKLDDGEVWLFARERQTAVIRYARVDAGNAGPWTTAGRAGAVQPWATGPVAAYTGMVRVLASSANEASSVYQTTFSDQGWDDWTKTSATARATRTPAATQLNADLNVVTVNGTTMSEQLVK